MESKRLLKDIPPGCVKVLGKEKYVPPVETRWVVAGAYRYAKRMTESKMNMEKTVEQLEKELKDLQEYHNSIWQTYGSELCAGEMLHKEKYLQDQINKLKK